jgi:hypothetical protein
MPDDVPRSTQGQRPDQRRGRGAPPWWDMLDRSDLPDDRSTSRTIVESPGWSARRDDARVVGSGRGPRLAAVVSVAGAVVLAALLIVGVWLATSTIERSAGPAAAVLAGIPAALLAASLLVALIGRGRHRRH